MCIRDRDEQVPFEQLSYQAFERALASRLPQPQRSKDGARDQPRVGQARQVHEEHIARRHERRSPAHFNGEAGLATTSWADQADQPVLREPAPDQLDRGAAPDEPRELAREDPRRLYPVWHIPV